MSFIQWVMTLLVYQQNSMPLRLVTILMALPRKNIDTFTKQLYTLGFDYDWSKMIKTSDPDFL